ncbi:MAG TPA: DUF5659 domain-containing protein [Candidatus Saccharimonadales bacterium]|nr:DUF5659 domain-containing protein [Candidatus Saccharimonadales bacterium]
MNTQNNTPTKEAHISDFGLVAALVTSGFGIQRTERIGNRVFFIFGKDDDFTKSIDDYWAGMLRVYARQYFDNTKMLKNLIYSEGLK